MMRLPLASAAAASSAIGCGFDDCKRRARRCQQRGDEAGLLDYYQSGDNRRLDAYSATRLPAVWHAVEFSHWMLDRYSPRPTEGRFHEGLRETRLARLMSGGLFAREFAINNVNSRMRHDGGLRIAWEPHSSMIPSLCPKG